MKIKVPATGKGELRKFGIVNGSILAVLFGLVLPWLFGLAYTWWPWAVGGVLAAAGLLLPAALRPIYVVWMSFAMVLGEINSRLVLALLFFGIFFPTALVMRLIGRDAMARGLDPGSESYRIPSRVQSREKLEKPF